MVGVQRAAATRTLRDLINRQEGLVSRQQARRAGWTDDAIRAQLVAGRWQRLHRAVYATYSGPLSWRARVLAAVLAAGPGAVTSHETAAALHGLREPHADEPVHVTVPVSRRVEPLPGVTVHYAHRLDATRHPTAWPPRTRVEDTVLDLVDRAADPVEVEAWVTRACQRRRTTPARLSAAAGRRRKLRFRRVVQALVDDVAAGAESPLELEYLRIERRHGLPRARRQKRYVGQRVVRVDAEIESARLRVELDGRTGHVEEGAFRDRRRDNGATVDGQATLRYGAAELFGTPCEVAAEVARVARTRGWAGQPRPCGPGCAVGRAAAPLRAGGAVGRTARPPRTTQPHDHESLRGL